ncbi:hypothetical protein Tco_0827658 [Tanacetum coccineum]
MLVQNQAPEGEGSAIHLEPQPTPSISQPNVSEPQIASLHIETSPSAAPQTEAHQTAVSQIVFYEAHIEQIPPSPTTYQRKRKTQKCRITKKDIELPQTSVPLDHGADEAVHKEGGDSVERAITTDARLDAAHDSDNIFKTQSTTRSERVLEQPNKPPLSEGHTSRSGEGKMEQTFELTDNVPSTPHDSPLTGGYTPRSDEGRMKLDALITLCIKLSKQKRVKKLKRKRKSSISRPRRKYRQVENSSDDGLDEEDASKQGRKSDKIKPITVAVTISTAKPRTPPSSIIVFDDKDVTMAMAQTLIKIKEQKAKEKGVAITDVEDSFVRPVRSITTLQPLLTIDPKDKGKGVLVEEEHVKIKIRDQGDLQIQADAELAQRLHEEELAELKRRQKERLQQEEREQFTIEERAQFLEETIAAQRKFRAAQRAAEIRSKPPTKTQLRNLMITYLKNTGGYKYSQLKGKTYEEIHGLYERQQKRNQDFIPMDTEVINDSGKKNDSISKPAEGKDVAMEQKSVKSDEEAATDYKHEKEELRMWLTVVSDEEENVDLKILSAKYPIVDWESQNLRSIDMEDLHVYKIIRTDGNTTYHKSLSSMLKKFDRQDLVDLHRWVMKRFKDTTPKGYNLLLWGDLKSSYITDGWYFDLLQHASREKVSSHQRNAAKDVELEARS